MKNLELFRFGVDCANVLKKQMCECSKVKVNIHQVIFPRTEKQEKITIKLLKKKVLNINLKIIHKIYFLIFSLSFILSGRQSTAVVKDLLLRMVIGFVFNCLYSANCHLLIKKTRKIIIQ